MNQAKTKRKSYVIIVAGGSGRRMNTELPKQFMLLGSRPVLMHTLDRFARFDRYMELVLVLPESHFSTWEKLCMEHHFKTAHRLVRGGSERFTSVKNGLDAIPDGALVLIHDGVRPLVSRSTIERCCNMAEQEGNAIPVLPVIESLRMVDGGHSEMVDRSKFVGIQTPQVFHSELIKAAYRQPFDAAFTDDASVLEKTGVDIHLVEGNRENIKITHFNDLKMAEVLLDK